MHRIRRMSIEISLSHDASDGSFDFLQCSHGNHSIAEGRALKKSQKKAIDAFDFAAKNILLT